MTTPLEAYLDTLATSHRIRVRVFVLDANETIERDISEFIVSGQVDLDTTTRPDRALELTLLDPDYRLAILTPNSPALGGLWAGSILRVYYDVLVPLLGAWVQMPVFTGPVTTFAREGAQVTVQATGKETFLQTPHHYDGVLSSAQVLRVDQTRKAALTALLRAIGEPQTITWSGTTDKLPKTYDARRDFNAGDQSYLYLANHIIGAGNQFFFDGFGTPVVRLPHPETGIDLTRYVTTAVSASFDVTEVRNRAEAHVVGKKGGTVGAEIVTIKDNDPLSGLSLARGGIRRYLDAGMAGSPYKEIAAARNAAERMLRGTGVLTVTFEALPLPFLQPGDLYTVSDPSGAVISFSVERFSLGLGIGDSMSVGYTRQVLDPANSKARFQKRRSQHAR